MSELELTEQDVYDILGYDVPFKRFHFSNFTWSELMKLCLGAQRKIMGEVATKMKLLDSSLIPKVLWQSDFEKLCDKLGMVEV